MTVLYVEDEENDVVLMRRAFKAAGLPPEELLVAEDGGRALAYLKGEPPYAGSVVPRLILLDLNLTGYTGFEVLERLRRDERCARVPVVVFSSSGRAEDRERARALGADDYVLKPMSLEEFLEIARSLVARWRAAGSCLP